MIHETMLKDIKDKLIALMDRDIETAYDVFVKEMGKKVWKPIIILRPIVFQKTRDTYSSQILDPICEHLNTKWLGELDKLLLEYGLAYSTEKISEISSVKFLAPADDLKLEILFDMLDSPDSWEDSTQEDTTDKINYFTEFAFQFCAGFRSRYVKRDYERHKREYLFFLKKS